MGQPYTTDRGQRRHEARSTARKAHAESIWFSNVTPV